MKKPLPLFLTIAVALSTSIVCAQDGPPPADAPRREDDRRPEGDRPPRPEDFDQPGGPGFPGERRDRPKPGDRLRDGLPPLPAKPQPYLGVATGPLDPALSAQLGFTPGIGLVVEEVFPDGPAAKAGVQPLDVLKQLNDQLVSNPAQLGALARHFGKDADVTLLVLRKGQEQKITVKIGERMMREPSPLRQGMMGGMGLPGMGRQQFERRGENYPHRNDDDADRPREPRYDGVGLPPRKSADLFREVGPGGAPEVRTFQESASTTWNTANAKVSLKDATGEIEVRSENGKRSLTAKNAQGEPAFDGPIDTEEQRKSVPAEFRKMLEQVEAHSRADRRPGARPPAETESPKPRRNPPEIQ